MKLDREKFLAAALLLSATAAAPGCSKGDGANDKASADTGGTSTKSGVGASKSQPAKLVNPPTREGVAPAPAKEGVAPAPAKEGVAPAPAAEGAPAKPTGPLRMPAK